MKCLTLTQPWATLVVVGAKRIETRSWLTYYRGPLAIHAAKNWTRDDILTCFESPFSEVLTAAGYFTPASLPRGAVIGLVNLADVRLIGRGTIPGFTGGSYTHTIQVPDEERERHFGNYTAGRYAWLLTDAISYIDPAPARGRQGLWQWDPLKGRREQQ